MSSETNTNDQMPKKSPLSFQVDLKKFEKATDEEKRQQDVMSESVSFFKDGMRKLMKNPLAVGSIIVLIAIIAMILIVPHVVPYKYSQIITVKGTRDKTASNMAPFTYSEKEQQAQSLKHIGRFQSHREADFTKGEAHSSHRHYR